MRLPQDNISPQELREKYIELLAEATDSTEKAKSIADELFALDLTVYSKDYTFDSVIYNAFSQSKLDETVSMHPEQLQIIQKIIDNDALIVSAPTSFGKTFSIFEYMARYQPQNIVLIVPTLALVDEYMKKLIKKYENSFSEYKVHSQIDPDAEYDFTKKNIFVLTHDRVVQDETYKSIKSIDFLVVDEVYKLETDVSNDRVLVLNMAYYYLSQKSKKYVLLAPFIKAVEDIDLLDKKPYFYNTLYSPVVNKVEVIEILNGNDRFPQCQKLLGQLNNDDKTLVYFPTVRGIYRYVNDFISQEPILESLDDGTSAFISWAKDEIHEEWSVVKALERGYTIHNGQIPLGIRLFQLNLYENSEVYNKLLCTSTLLEGVNTSAKNIIITSPSRQAENGDNFSAFDFYNLVGRTGRLNQHYIGDAYYIKAPDDPDYKKIDAIRSIRFEITDSSKDIDIQTGNVENHDDYLQFINGLGITHDDYIKHIGNHFRFESVKALYSRYVNRKSELACELNRLLLDTKAGRLGLIKILYAIFEGREDAFKANLLNSLINRRRPKLHAVVDNAMKYFSSRGIDTIISTAIQLKTSYIEHQFYAKLILIKYFMSLDKFETKYFDVLDGKVTAAIEHLYFSASKQKKMLLDIGIYERDIDYIISIIGDGFSDVFEMKKLLKEKMHKLRNIGYISSYIIKSL